MNEKCIGIVGGVGPYAGLDLNKKIFDQTIANADQEHLRVVLISSSEDIPDRTDYISGGNTDNPAESIFKVIQKLERIGADVAGIPCNTAYAPAIFDVLLEKLRRNGSRIRVVHMIREVADMINDHYRGAKKIGILGTNGTVKSLVYTLFLEPRGLCVIYPDEDIQLSLVHSSIYDKRYGIKTYSAPVTEEAKNKIAMAMKHLVMKGCDAIVLGCTELPLAINDMWIDDRPVIDATLILARALIRESAPDKLKTYALTQRVFNNSLTSIDNNKCIMTKE